MKPHFIIVFAFIQLITGKPAIGQNPNHDEMYEGESFHMQVWKLDGTLEDIKPLGKSPIVGVDRFFKKYTIFYTDENGKYGYVKLFYVGKGKSGQLIMRNDHDEQFFLMDGIEKDGKLIFTPREPKERNFVFVFVVDGLKKSQ